MKNRIHALFAALALALGTITTAQASTHPGIPLTTADLDAVKANLNVEPWKSGYAALAADSHSQLSYTMQGPFAHVGRNESGTNPNLNQWRNDMIAVWNLARMWYFTENPDYAQKARDILIAWANTQTSFGGMESGLDLGDYAYRFGGGADILRGTWPGWTQADTDAVKNLFGNVYWPATSMPTDELGPTNKGSLSLAAGAAIAVFCDDQTKLDKVLYELRTFSSTGFQNTLTNGEHGETGRDQGHSYNHILATSFVAEVLWKQGIDVYAERNNRLLTMAEYYARFNLAVNTPFISMGTTDEYYHGIWDSPGYPGNSIAFNILKSAYVLRKGLNAPYMEIKRAAQPNNYDSFMFLKSADSSTATPPAAITWPGASLVSTGMTNVDINGASPAGSGTYSNGVWTVSGEGSDIWTHGSERFHYLYKQVTGDCAIIAKVNSVQFTTSTAKAGVMIRSDLNATPACKAWVTLRPDSHVETYFHGWSEMYGGSNWEAQGYWIPQSAWWVKVERLGNIVTTYASPDGTSWATQAVGRCENLGNSPYLGLCVTSMVSGTLCTATFSNVSITSGNGAAPVAAPAAPLAVYASPGDGKAHLRWVESFGVTAYNVKRSTTSGGPYTTVATVAGANFLDTSATNDTTYYYVVSGSNSAGEGANSPEDVVTPRVSLVNIATTGTATDNINNSTGTEGAAKAFDLNSGSKWYGSFPGWLQYDLGAGNGQAVTAYDIISADDVPERDPKDWQFQGSNDGTSWTTLDTQTGQTFAYRYFPKRYILSNTAAWRYYRLNVTANYGGSSYGTQLSELALLKPATSTPPPAVPAGLSATPVSINQIDLGWNAVSGASSYIVKRATSSGGPYTIIATEVGGTTFSSTGLVAGTTYYYVVSALGAGGESSNSAEASATTFAPVTLSPVSVAAQDGYITASSSANTAGGNINSTSTLRTGDSGGGNANRQYKTIVSFDTSAIPDNAVIVSATLKLRCASINGTNPFTALGACNVDIKGVSGFNNSTTLETTDFQAAADATQVAAMTFVSSVGTWSTGSLNADGLGILNKLGTTQFRVCFSTPTNSNNTADYISWNSGDDTTASYRPVLELVYSINGPSVQPKALLKFDESTGTTAADSTGNGWTGTLVNSPTWGAGKLNNAVNVTGGSYVSLPPGVVSSLGDFTVSAWVKLNTLSSNSRIFDFGTSTPPGSTTGSYMFLTPSNGSTVRFAMTTAGYSNETSVAGTTPLTTGTWTHVAVTLSGSTCKLYVNGVAVGTNTGFTLKPYNLGGTTQNYIGKSQFSAVPALDGAVDDFRIYNRALGAAEITDLANPPVITSTLSVTGWIATPFSYQIAATNLPTSYSASGLPAGFSLVNNTGLISGMPTVTGSFNVTIGASNSAGTGTATLAFNVLPQVPVITSTGTASGFSNTAFSYQITADNTPTSYAATNLPTGLSVNTSTGLISGTPAVTGTFTATISASNAGGTDTADLSIVLGAPLSAPANLVATAGNATVSLTWNAVDGATSYNIKRSVTSGSAYTTVASGEIFTSFADTSVTNSTAYYYVVSPVNDYGEGPNSNEVSATPMSPYTWTGLGADANWQTAANWSAVPTAGVTPYFAGSTRLTNTNDFSANTSFSGIVFSSGAGAFSLGGNAITLTGDIVNNSTSAQTLTLPIILSGVGRTINAAGGDIALTGTVSGGFGLVKTGIYTLTLSGNNTFTGGVTGNAGTIVVTSGSALGTGAMTLAGGKLQNTGNLTLTNAIYAQVATSSTLTTVGSNLTLNGNLTGSGTITRNASGSAASVYLGGSNSGFSGTFISNADNSTATRLTSSAAGSENARWVINTNVSTRVSAEFGGTGAIKFGSLTGSGILSAGGNAGTKTFEVGNLGLDESFTGIISQFGTSVVGAVTKVGNGTWTLTGANSYTGPTIINSGTLAVSGAGTLGATSGSLTVSGGSLYLGSTSQTKGAVTISSGSITSGTLAGTSFTCSNSGSISATLSGSSATLTKSGTGTLTLSGSNTFDGTATVSGGTLNLTGSLASAVTVSNGGTLAGTGSNGGSVAIASGGVIAPGDAGAGTLNVNGLLMLNNGAVLNMELGTTGTSDKIQLGGSIAASGTTTINLTAISGFGEGTYTLISGTATVSAANFALGTVPAGYGGTLNAAAGVLSVAVVKIPDAPINLSAAAGDALASLTWTSVNGATTYIVKRSLTSGSGYAVLAGGTTAAVSYADAGLANGTTYYYVVSAVNSAGESANSTQASALPLNAIQSWRLDNFGIIDNTGNSADTADPDGDGWSNAQEFAAGTDPNDRASLLKVSQMQANGNDMLVSFPTVAGKTYRVERSDTLQSGSWTTVQDNIIGNGSTMQATDTGGAAQPRRFYRVVVLP